MIWEKRCMYIYDWVTWLYGRNRHTIVNQLYFNKKKCLKAKKTGQVFFKNHFDLNAFTWSNALQPHTCWFSIPSRLSWGSWVLKLTCPTVSLPVGTILPEDRFFFVLIRRACWSPFLRGIENWTFISSESEKKNPLDSFRDVLIWAWIVSQALSLLQPIFLRKLFSAVCLSTHPLIIPQPDGCWLLFYNPIRTVPYSNDLDLRQFSEVFFSLPLISPLSNGTLDQLPNFQKCLSYVFCDSHLLIFHFSDDTSFFFFFLMLSFSSSGP